MWVWIALTASCLQTARNACARSLAGTISPALNSWARFAFNLPLSLLLILGLQLHTGFKVVSPAFLGYCLLTALFQILGNTALIAAFHRASFAQSIVFHKLEVVFAALIGIMLFRETPSLLAWGGIVLCGVGVLWLNIGRDTGPQGWRRALHLDQGALLALLCALLLVFASFMIKGAYQAFVHVNPFLPFGSFEAAVHTVFHVTWIEVAIMTGYLLGTRPGELALVRKHWRRMALIGSTSFAGSLGWFWAFSLTLVAYVKAVSQIESVLAVGLGLLLWHEREVVRQLPGVVLILGGITLVLCG